MASTTIARPWKWAEPGALEAILALEERAERAASEELGALEDLPAALQAAVDLVQWAAIPLAVKGARPIDRKRRMWKRRATVRRRVNRQGLVLPRC